MELNVLIFGPLALELGTRTLRVKVLEPAHVDDVRQALAAHCEKRHEFFLNARLAVNGVFADAHHRVDAEDEVAVIEMVSGG